MKKKSVLGRLKPLSALMLWILPVIVCFAAICIGRVGLSPIQVISAIASKLGGQSVPVQVDRVIFTIRIPRVIMAMIVGAGLSVSGCVFQSLFANPLATPDTLGVASGAGFGAALAILFGAGMIGIQILSLICGLLAVVLTYISAVGKMKSANTLILSGIMIGSWFSALLSLVKFLADTESVLPAITFWLMGSFNTAGLKSLSFGAPPVVICIIILFLIRWRLNILPLPDDEARSTGTNIKGLRLVTVICATFITASCVSMCGQVGWVGLLVPHICRMWFGNNHLSLIPASISIGAVFMVITDTIARSATAAQIPISALTAVVGAPVFIILIRKTGGWKL